MTLRLVALAALLGVAACAEVPPSGPAVMALPAAGKSLEAFQREDTECRSYAVQATGDVDGQHNGVKGAVLGTALGAGAGAALGSIGGAAGAGAAIGGATGLLAGSAIGADNAARASGSAQSRYDTAYTQCMYARGNSVQAAPRAYAYDYGYAPGYSYGYPYYAGPAFVLGFGGGFHHSHHHHFHHHH